MAKNKLGFPQIYRIIPARITFWGFKILILSFLTAFLAVNLFPHLPADFLTFERAKLTVMLSPNDVSGHLLLTQEYLKRGDMEAVERELTLTQGLTTNYRLPATNSVLGASLSPLKILEKIKNEPQRIKGEIAFWEKVVADKPDYRDAYLQLAILNYQVYEKDKAREYLQKALGIDPNYEPTKKLKEIINN